MYSIFFVSNIGVLSLTIHPFVVFKDVLEANCLFPISIVRIVYCLYSLA